VHFLISFTPLTLINLNSPSLNLCVILPDILLVKINNMTRFILSVAALVVASAAVAQAPSGKIVFEETVKMEIKLQGEDAERFKDLIPKERKMLKTLYYTPESSVYLTEKKESEDLQQETEGAVVRIKMGNAEEKVFCDLKNGVRLEQKEFMSRKFLVTGELGIKTWKMTGNQRTILGYPCQEAVQQDSLNKTVVWFTPAIPVSAGPGSFAGLPGMVLLVNMNEGKYVMEAKSVEPGTVDQALLVKPKEGKKVTQEEYKKIVDEKMKEMQVGNGGSGGNMIIRMETH
jgi:GLPGLI family protein